MPIAPSTYHHCQATFVGNSDAFGCLSHYFQLNLVIAGRFWWGCARTGGHWRDGSCVSQGARSRQTRTFALPGLGKVCAQRGSWHIVLRSVCIGTGPLALCCRNEHWLPCHSRCFWVWLQHCIATPGTTVQSTSPRSQPYRCPSFLSPTY